MPCLFGPTSAGLVILMGYVVWLRSSNSSRWAAASQFDGNSLLSWVTSLVDQFCCVMFDSCPSWLALSTLSDVAFPHHAGIASQREPLVMSHGPCSAVCFLVYVDRSGCRWQHVGIFAA